MTNTNRILVIGESQYKVEEEIGHGLHSTVYGGYDLSDNNPVAIKVVNFASGINGSSLSTEARQHSYWKEIELLLYLQNINPYVIRIFNHDQTDRYGMIVMERGGTFRDTLIQFLRLGMRMPLSYVQKFWSQMVSAIYYMHHAGIVHGDCKPENFIQVGKHGGTLRLIDMGISFELPPNVTSRLHAAAGTPDYVAPEMVHPSGVFTERAKFGYKADVWALGIILFEMVFGFRPLQYLGNSERKISFLGRLRRDMNIPYHPDRELRDILRRCLRSNHRRRPDTEEILNHPFLTRPR
ncbi:unnamed protein product [Adineta steineri]|uniref:Protein kinase domain-containing protein n=1 Tax=Adineta steineri TaxID=433720 RepID=A0A815PHQ7_9BILA|nr:unnamed protein product [Adineta steineri]CAF1449178.1 unnamed protein product [Adineta steineri]